MVTGILGSGISIRNQNDIESCPLWTPSVSEAGSTQEQTFNFAISESLSLPIPCLSLADKISDESPEDFYSALATSIINLEGSHLEHVLAKILPNLSLSLEPDVERLKRMIVNKLSSLISKDEIADILSNPSEQNIQGLLKKISTELDVHVIVTKDGSDDDVRSFLKIDVYLSSLKGYDKRFEDVLSKFGILKNRESFSFLEKSKIDPNIEVFEKIKKIKSHLIEAHIALRNLSKNTILEKKLEKLVGIQTREIIEILSSNKSITTVSDIQEAIKTCEKFRDFLIFTENKISNDLKKRPSIFLNFDKEMQPADQDCLNFPEGDFIVHRTKADGSCAFHALLGEKFRGQFEARAKGFSSVRHEFISRLEEIYKSNNTEYMQIKDCLYSCIRSREQDLFSASQPLDANARDLITAQEGKLKSIKQEIFDFWKDKFSDSNIRELIIFHWKQKHRTEIEENTFSVHFDKIFDIICENQVEFSNLLNSEQSKRLVALEQKKSELVDWRNNKNIIDYTAENFFSSYISWLEEPNNWLHTDEIELVARVYRKNFRVFNDQLVEVKKWPEDGNGPFITILGDGTHFSRCMPIENGLKGAQFRAIKTFGLAEECSRTKKAMAVDAFLREYLQIKLSADVFEEEYIKSLDAIYLELFPYTGSVDANQQQEQSIDLIQKTIQENAENLPQKILPKRTLALSGNIELLRSAWVYLKKHKFAADLAYADEQHVCSLLEKNITLSNQKAEEILDLLTNCNQQDRSTLVNDLYKVLFDATIEGDLQDAKNDIQLYNRCHGSVPIHLGEIDQNINELEALFEKNSTPLNFEKDELCLEELLDSFVSCNNLTSEDKKLLKQQITDIRLNIEDIKMQRKVLSHNLHYGSHASLIAEICVKIEMRFGEVLRDSQLLTIVSMLRFPGSKGVLSEVKTGEGKTFIAAALAIVNCKMGKTVDVITSSETYARRDSEYLKELFEEDFGIKVFHNCDNSNQGVGAKACYEQNAIVYGTAASFQGDWLRDDFYQMGTFGNREDFRVAIVDEVDNTLIDKISRSCLISEPVAGMVALKPFIYLIWNLLRKEIKARREELTNPSSDGSKIIEQIKLNTLEEFKKLYRENNYKKIIPSHLYEYVDGIQKIWVDNAVRALFMSMNRQYTLSSSDSKIIPVDYNITGEWESELRWQDGLHQFLQMKNGVDIDTETLTKCFMSNRCLIQKYSKIYGISGTLGGEEESNVFREVYKTKVQKIPKYKPDKTIQKQDICVLDKDDWYKSLHDACLEDGGRSATLILCETIDDVKKIEENFLKFKFPSKKIITYTNGDTDKDKIKKAIPGTVILATNLAGRGADIDATSIEKFGGLHVIFSFLPNDDRVQQQGYGRTARKGLSGTKRMIICCNELDSDMLENREFYFSSLPKNFFLQNPSANALSFQGVWYKVIQDDTNDDVREILLEPLEGGAEEKESLRIVIRGDGFEVAGKKQDISNSKFSIPFIDIKKILAKRDEKYKASLNKLLQNLDDRKEKVFNDFKEMYHSFLANIQIPIDLLSQKDNFVTLLKNYVMDKWALYLHKLEKNQTLDTTIEEIIQGAKLEHINQGRDLYAMRYTNITLDITGVSNEKLAQIYEHADNFYESIANDENQEDNLLGLTEGFARYNQSFVKLKMNTANIKPAIECLEKAADIFKACKLKEEQIISLRYYSSEEAQNEEPKQNKQVEASGTYRLIQTMLNLINKNKEALKEYAKDYGEVYISFDRPEELLEKPNSTHKSNLEADDIASIPPEILDDAILLGLKGALNIKPKGNSFAAWVCLVGCILVGVLALALLPIGVGVLGGMLVGCLSSIAIAGTIHSIKGIISNNFSLNHFGKEIAVAALTGAIGGAIFGGVLSIKSVDTIIRSGLMLQKVAVFSALGAASGVATGAASYLASCALNNQTLTATDFFKSIGQSAVVGLFGGAFTGATHTDKLRKIYETISGAIGGGAGDLIGQSFEMCCGDRNEIDIWRVLENGCATGVHAGLATAVRQRQQQKANLKKQSQCAMKQHVVDNPPENPKPLVENSEILKKSTPKPVSRDSQQIQTKTAKASGDKQAMFENLNAALKKTFSKLRECNPDFMQRFMADHNLNDHQHFECMTKLYDELFNTLQAALSSMSKRKFPNEPCHLAAIKGEFFEFGGSGSGICAGGDPHHQSRVEFDPHMKSINSMSIGESVCAPTKQQFTNQELASLINLETFDITSSKQQGTASMFGGKDLRQGKNAPRQDGDPLGLYKSSPGKNGIDTPHVDQNPEISISSKPRKHPQIGGEGDIYGDVQQSGQQNKPHEKDKPQLVPNFGEDPIDLRSKDAPTGQFGLSYDPEESTFLTRPKKNKKTSDPSTRNLEEISDDSGINPSAESRNNVLDHPLEPKSAYRAPQKTDQIIQPEGTFSQGSPEIGQIAAAYNKFLNILRECLAKSHTPQNHLTLPEQHSPDVVNGENRKINQNEDLLDQIFENWENRFDSQPIPEDIELGLYLNELLKEHISSVSKTKSNSNEPKKLPSLLVDKKANPDADKNKSDEDKSELKFNSKNVKETPVTIFTLSDSKKIENPVFEAANKNDKDRGDLNFSSFQNALDYIYTTYDLNSKEWEVSLITGPSKNLILQSDQEPDSFSIYIRKKKTGDTKDKSKFDNIEHKEGPTTYNEYEAAELQFSLGHLFENDPQKQPSHAHIHLRKVMAMDPNTGLPKGLSECASDMPGNYLYLEKDIRVTSSANPFELVNPDPNKKPSQKKIDHFYFHNKKTKTPTYTLSNFADLIQSAIDRSPGSLKFFKTELPNAWTDKFDYNPSTT